MIGRTARTLCTALCASLWSVSAQAAPPADAAGVKFFEERVRPLLVEACFSCHGPEKQKGGLRLDSRAAALKGGDSGAAVVPGDTAAGMLLDAVSYVGDFKMPPKGKLAPRQIADLETWVKLGAPWPAGSSPNSPSPILDPKVASQPTPAASDHWAFRPVRDVAPPTPRNEMWARTPIDRFVLAKLEAQGLRPAPAADKRTLIRRAYFDLLGLPPAPEEVSAFVGDSSPDAFAKVVDRLLASPQYGERWGRHWLDVARYADSNGMDENLSYANAWRYRDWVIGAFNADMPYDQFIRQQVAGDLLSPQSQEAVIPTGFLMIGPKMLAEDDPVKMHMDIVDEQLDTLGQAFLGMTLGCARCHDHKFDPIPTRDYYALAGILKSTKTMESFTVVAKWQDRSLASPAELAKDREYDVRIAAVKQEIAALEQAAKQDEPATLSRRTAGFLAAAAERQKERGSQRKKLEERIAALEKARPALPSAMAVSEGKPGNLRVHIRGNHLTLGAEVPKGFPAVLSVSQQPTLHSTGSGRRELADWLTRPDHPLTARVAVNRIWTWHFGDGLVRTPDNFGRLGDIPVHGELIDWLATRFVKEGWSVKKLHRLMMSSATYQMSTAYDATADRKDPENRWLWRWNRQRLDAESFRDALLAMSGTLDRTRGGTLLTVPNHKYVTSTANRAYNSYQSDRRSVYLPVVRSASYEPFQSFDFPDPSVPKGRRSITTVPAQSLVLMNSDLVQQQTRKMAARLLSLSGDTPSRIQRAWELVFGRPATMVEVDRATNFLSQYEAAAVEEKIPAAEVRVRAWQGLCRSLVSSNEFVYVE